MNIIEEYVNEFLARTYAGSQNLHEIQKIVIGNDSFYYRKHVTAFATSQERQRLVDSDFV